jgi:hypothetical protein
LIAGFFSTDWSAEPAPDPEKSAITGKPEFSTDKKLLTFGGTMLQRGAMPAMELKEHGWDAYLSFRLDAAPDGHLRLMDTEGNWREPDLVWMQRHMAEGLDVVIRKARAAGQIVVNDLDDSFGAGILPSTNIASKTTDPNENPTFNRVHYYKNIAASSAITVSTMALQREMERMNVPVFLLRNVVDMERWPQLDPTTEGAVGWIGGVQWRARDLQQLKPWLPNLLLDCDLPFYHGGDSNVPGVPKAWTLAGIDSTKIQCITSPLCHIAEYPKMWAPLNVSLIPLEDCKFNRAKSSLKALESSACGLPFIVSDLPEQRWFVEHGGAGRLAKNWKPKTWEDHLVDLFDPEVRRVEGARNRAHAFEFDIHTRWVDWAACYAMLEA